jgi:predicted XRE-type DNA-binding protein
VSTRPTPPHGSETRYKGTRFGRPPCRCKLCTRANRLAGIRRERARNAGEELLIGRDVILPHLEKLRASGMSQALIARHAHVSQTTVSYLLNGKIQSCQRDNALGILAVQPGQFDDLAERPALGACRRTRALYAIGHGRESISAACGLSVCTIGQIANSRYTLIDGRIDAAIRLAYRLLASVPGPSDKAKRRAASQGWRDPQWWEDYGRIDDPKFDPATVDCELNFHERAKLRREEIEHLAWCGHQPEQILDRLNNEVSIATVRQIVQEWRTGQKRQRKQVAA